MVEREDLVSFALLCQSDQACVREVGRQICICAQNTFDFSSRARYLERNLEYASLDVCQHCPAGTLHMPKQIAGFGNDRLACDQWAVYVFYSTHRPAMIALVPIQERDDHAGVKQNRFHRPKFFKCFLFEPKSRTSEENSPKPMMRCDTGRAELHASSSFMPSRTISEGERPRRRIRRFNASSD